MSAILDKIGKQKSGGREKEKRSEAQSRRTLAEILCEFGRYFGGEEPACQKLLVDFRELLGGNGLIV